MHRLHSKPALGQDVGQMLWCGAPEHACGARPCLQTGPAAPPKTESVMVCGTGGWKRVQQTGLTLFYPCLPGDVGLAEVER